MTTVAHGCIASRTLATVRRLPPAIVQLPPAILGLPPALEKPAFASEFLFDSAGDAGQIPGGRLGLAATRQIRELT